MFVCVYIYIYVCVCTCICICICVYKVKIKAPSGRSRMWLKKPRKKQGAQGPKQRAAEAKGGGADKRTQVFVGFWLKNPPLLVGFYTQSSSEVLGSRRARYMRGFGFDFLGYVVDTALKCRVAG